MEECKTDSIFFIWLQIHSHVRVEFFNISHYSLVSSLK